MGLFWTMGPVHVDPVIPTLCEGMKSRNGRDGYGYGLLKGVGMRKNIAVFL